MKLAFSGEGRYVDFSDGYRLYCNRRRHKEAVDEKTYRRIIRLYCKYLSERLCREGMVDLPTGIGSIAAITITRKPQYRGKQFVGYGKKDWEDRGQYDGKLKTFGLTFLPKRDRTQNLRCYGFVGNRELFKRIKKGYLSGECNWIPLGFKDEMI